MQRNNQPGGLSVETNDLRERLFSALISEILRVMSLRGKSWARLIVGNLLKLPVYQLVDKLIRLDENVARHGWSAAIGGFLADFVSEYRVTGLENVPRQGSLLVVGNHPGSYDMPILSTVMGRDDLKVITSDIAVVRLLPNIAEHFIFISRDVHKSMLTVRTAIRHLRDGGSVLIFPRGDVEPDQDVSPGGMPNFERWSQSSEFFLRKAPQTRVLVVFTRGVLSPRWFKSPLVRIWKKPARRQKVAEILQVAQQLSEKQKFSLTPSLAFSRLLSVEELGTLDSPDGHFLNALIEQMRTLIREQFDPTSELKV